MSSWHDPDTMAAEVRRVDTWLGALDDEPWVVQTSGSTGIPKQVELSRAAVRASAAASAARLGQFGGLGGQGGVGRWTLALPPTYVAGFNVIARALLAGHAPKVWSEGPLPPADFISLVPTQLVRLLEEQPDALASHTAVLVGGGPIPPGLRGRAEAAGIPVVATYGSAETCGGCVYDGLPLDGVAVAIETDGRIRIGGPTIFSGYRNAGADAAVDAMLADALVDGWFRTADAGRLDADGRLEVLGRLDDMVISGGVKVSAPAVAARLVQHPDLSTVEVLGVDDPQWGQRVVAFVVGQVSLDAARDWVGQSFPRSWAPRQVVAVDQMPMLGNGKIDRLALRRLAQ